MANLRVAVLLSGSGTTLENLFVKREAGALHADIVVVVGSRAGAYGLERARQRGVPAITVARRKYSSVDEFSRAVFAAVEPFEPKLICLAGFMSLLQIPPEFEQRIMNVHPALLPAFGGKGFYGHNVHEAVLKHGCRVSGCTVHFVDNDYDHGPIIMQKAVPVLSEDTSETLAARVQEAERELYPLAVELFAQGRLKVEDRSVRILPG
jgi:formyltetrahydrofolate-dependent phosphoribosylglycinamide formyltransferase